MASNNSTVPTPDLYLPEEWMNITLYNLNLYLNIISIAAAVLVELIIFVIWLYDRKLVDRVSLRLTAAISFTDIINAAALLTYDEIDSNCNVPVFIMVWLTNQYIFFSCAIAFNLQYLLIHKKPFNPSFEKWYYIIPSILALSTGLVPLIAGRFGFDDTLNTCWYTPSMTTITSIWEYSTYLGPMALGIIYCTIISIALVIQIKFDSRKLRSPFPGAMSKQGGKNSDIEVRIQKTTRSVNRAVRRILLYCLIPFITQTGFILSEIYIKRTLSMSWPLSLWSVVGGAIPGLCNFLAFLLDPVVFNAWRTVKKNLIEQYSTELVISKDSSGNITTRYSQNPKQVKATNRFLCWFTNTFLLRTSRNDNTLFMMSNSISQTHINTSATSFSPYSFDNTHPDTHTSTLYIPVDESHIPMNNLGTTPERLQDKENKRMTRIILHGL